MDCEDCDSRGWVLSYSYGSTYHPDGYYVQHCGSCNRFKSDKEVGWRVSVSEVDELKDAINERIVNRDYTNEPN